MSNRFARRRPLWALAIVVVAVAIGLPKPALAWWWFNRSASQGANPRDLRAFRQQFAQRFAPLPPGTNEDETPGARGVTVHTGKTLALGGWPSLSRTLHGVQMSAAAPWVPFLRSDQSVTLTTGTGQDSDYTSGLNWRSRFRGGDLLGVHMLYNAAPSAQGGAGQMLMGMTGSMAVPLAPQDVRLSGGFSTMVGDGGGFVQLARHVRHGLGFSVRGSRYSSGFDPTGFTAVAGEELVRTEAAYHFSSGMRLSGYSQTQLIAYPSLDPEMVREVGFKWRGPLLEALDDRPAVISLSSFFRRDRTRSHSLDRAVSDMDLQLTQPLWLGWDSRIDVALAHLRDFTTGQSASQGTVSVAGHHWVHLGPFRGTIGPGVAWRRRTGDLPACNIEAGLRFRLISAYNSLNLDLGYETDVGAFRQSNVGAFRTMLSYRIYLGADGAPTPSNPWYDLTLVNDSAAL